MASRDKILFLIGNRKDEDLMIREFFSKFPDDQQNKIAKSILCTILEFAGPKWNPILDGYPFLKENTRSENQIEPTKTFDSEKTLNAIQPKHENGNSLIKKPLIQIQNDSGEDNPIPVTTGFTKKSKETKGFRKI